MAPVVGAAFLPHPPILIPEIGRGEEKRASVTQKGFERVVEEIKNAKPQVIILLTPHGSSDTSLVNINEAEKLRGSFSAFGFPEINLQFDNHHLLAEALLAFGRSNNLSLSRKSLKLDHGALVPLYFLRHEGIQLPLVHVSVGYSDSKAAYRLGRELSRFLDGQEQKIMVIASGDLSHCLDSDGPYGFHPEGPRFDHQVKAAFENNSLKELLLINKETINDAGQCGLLSFIIAAGMLHQKPASINLHSYEGPFGVGYLCAYGSLYVTKEQHGAVLLATEAIRRYVEAHEKLDFKDFLRDYPEESFLREASSVKAGVFVSIHKEGNLRGCIGTVESVHTHVGIEIINNAIEAACRDPRFDPIDSSELEDLEINVDVLGAMEKVNSPKELDVQKYGVMVESGYRRGLLLPKLDGINSVNQQLSIACQKAGIGTNEMYQIYRFSVNRYE